VAELVRGVRRLVRLPDAQERDRVPHLPGGWLGGGGGGATAGSGKEPRREGERGGEGPPGWEMCPADEVKRTILRAAKNGGSAKAEETEDGGNHSNPPLRLLPSSILFQANAAGGNIGVQIIQGWGKSLPKGGVEGYQVAEGVDGLGDEAGGVAQEAGDGLHDDQQEVGPDPHHRHPLARVQVPPALLLYGSESGGGVMCVLGPLVDQWPIKQTLDKHLRAKPELGARSSGPGVQGMQGTMGSQ